MPTLFTLVEGISLKFHFVLWFSYNICRSCSDWESWNYILGIFSFTRLIPTSFECHEKLSDHHHFKWDLQSNQVSNGQRISAWPLSSHIPCKKLTPNNCSCFEMFAQHTSTTFICYFWYIQKNMPLSLSLLNLLVQF